MKSKDNNTPEIKLSHRQRLFADEYLVHGNGKKAAEKAGYAKGRAAEVAANRQLNNPKVKAYLDSKAQKIFDKLEITQERVMKEYARIAFSDLRQFYNADGSLKNIHDISDDAAGALASVESDELWITDEEGDRKAAGVTRKIKVWGKREALDSICRVKGWNAPEKKDVTTNGESLNQAPDLSGLSDEELRLLAKIKRKMNVEHL